MVLVRGASRMSLGTWGRRASKYQKVINLNNAFLTVCSIILIGIAFLLMYYYHVQDLDFWDPIFDVTPILMLSVGIITFFSCLFGFLISNHENRIPLIIMAILLSIAFLVQIASVYYAMELKFLINSATPGGKGDVEVTHYDEDGYEWVKPKWDKIQSQLRCCGGSESMNVGHLNYQNADAFKRKNTEGSVPDSCCKKQKEGCGRDINPNDLNPIIYRDGCVAILMELLKHEVDPILKIYMAVGVILALVELVTVVLACAYVAQIARRLKAQDRYSRPADANGDEYVPSLKTRESTF